MIDVRAGIYRHYKGPLYLVLGLAHDANAEDLYALRTAQRDAAKWPYEHVSLGERTVVVYVPLQLDGAHLGPRMAVRTLEDFTGEADVAPYTSYCSDRSACGGGNHVCCGHKATTAQRFTYLGPELTQEMLGG